MRTTPRLKTYTLIEGKSVFKISLIVLTLTIISVYFWGLGTHRTFFENSIISTTILSIAFFLFITVGLFLGVKLKHTKELIDKQKPTSGSVFSSAPDFTASGSSDIDLDVGDGCEGVIAGILYWILLAVIVAFTLWFFSEVFPVIIGTFVAMLYWIFFRALRLVFKNSNKSKGNLLESIKYGLMYTLLYDFWIYGIVLLTEYIKR
jgi:hypothetical protein